MGEKKSIAFVSNTLWSIFHFRFYIIRQLIDEGYQVIVLAPVDECSTYFINVPGLQLIPLQHLHPKKMLPWQEWQLYLELKKHYLNLQPDLIFHYTIKPNITGSFAAFSAKRKSVAVITGLGYTLLNNNIIRMITLPLYRAALKRTTQVWFLNEGDKIFFLLNKLVRSSHSFLLPGEGIDTDYFSPPINSALQKKGIKFLMISRILKNKGVIEYAEASKMLRQKYPDAECMLMGKYEPHIPDAVPKAIFNQWINEKTIFFIPYSYDVRTHIEKVDCVVLPSYSEGLSVSLMEAASMEKPLIASNVSGCRELVIHGITGLLCEPRNAADLFSKMEEFLQLSDENKTKMGKNGRRLMKEKFASSIVKKMYKEKIQQVLNGR